MHHTKHAVARMNQRGIAHAMAKLVCAYGTDHGDKIVLTQKAATARLVEARAEKAMFNQQLDTGCSDIFGVLRQLEEVEAEIPVLMKLIDKHGAVVVVVDNTLITAYGLH